MAQHTEPDLGWWREFWAENDRCLYGDYDPALGDYRPVQPAFGSPAHALPVEMQLVPLVRADMRADHGGFGQGEAQTVGSHLRGGLGHLWRTRKWRDPGRTGAISGAEIRRGRIARRCIGS